jgi:exodeoxyribonuclease-5
MLTKKQEEAVNLAIQKYKNGEKQLVIAGFAGVGKSFVARYIVSALAQFGINPETDVGYGAYTGKAAQVLSRSGNPNAITLHKLLYKAHMKSDGTFLFKKKETLEYKVLVIDECSMVPQSMVETLQQHNVFIIWLGDPFQIPPIVSGNKNTLLDHPDVFLDEIMRQAAESEIIQLSMKIRNHQPITEYNGKDIKVFNSDKLVEGMLTWADVIITATNRTRQWVNQTTRQLLGYPENKIVHGEKLTCLQNKWEITSNQDMPLINGTIGYIQNPKEHNYKIPAFMNIPDNKISVISGSFITDFGDKFGILNMDKNYIYQEQNSITPQQKYRMLKNPKLRDLVPLEFSYGYGITCHRAQGSSWAKVMVIEENFPFEKQEHSRWLYTAVTRSSSKLVLIKK